VLVVKGGGGKQGGGGGRDRKRREKAPYAFVESSRFSGATPAIMRFSTAPHQPWTSPFVPESFLGRSRCLFVCSFRQQVSVTQASRSPRPCPARTKEHPGSARALSDAWVACLLVYVDALPVGRSSSGRTVWLTASLEGALRPAHSTCE
jgi:hypothetical protein